MIGAALIKLRNDGCWRDLSCLDYHFETQPNPNPLAYSLHHAPHGVHVVGVLFNHFVELVVPWFVFGFRRWRHGAGALLVALQVTLILSGNLSFLNWLTIVPALACFDDTALVRLLPKARRDALLARFAALAPPKTQKRVMYVLGTVVGLLSVGPAVNLASCDQSMNRSFEPFELVNTYGAFGDVDRERYEVILEGTSDEDPRDEEPAGMSTSCRACQATRGGAPASSRRITCGSTGRCGSSATAPQAARPSKTSHGWSTSCGNC